MSQNKFFNLQFVFKFFFLLTLALLPVAVLAQQVSTAPTAAANCAAFKNQLNVTVNGTTTNIMSGSPFYCTASDLILAIINYALALSGTVTILFLMLGGFWYLTSAGNEEQSEKGKKTLINAVIGLVVIVMAFAIVKIVSNTLSLGK